MQDSTMYINLVLACYVFVHLYMTKIVHIFNVILILFFCIKPQSKSQY